MKVTPLIVGAGFSGLIAGCMFPDSRIVESSPEPKEGHQALLRFRSEVVSNVTGVPFRRVQVRKGIWQRGRFRAPTIQNANLYSRKVLGEITSRSIWDLAPVERWVAPLDFHARLLDKLRGRIEFGVNWSPSKGSAAPVLSTIPMSVMLGLVDFNLFPQTEAFRHKPITVVRYTIPKCDVFQTIYFPGLAERLYRASLTGDALILELTGESATVAERHRAFELAGEAFGLPFHDMDRDAGVVSRQRYGKIAEFADDSLRKALIQKLSAEHHIYSVGRFATWRNILLDDVVQDLKVVERLMHASEYERNLIRTKEN